MTTPQNNLGHWICDIPMRHDAIGFVYTITNKTDDTYYIGKKLMIKKVGRKYKESDWKSYISSSKPLKEAITSNKDNYIFRIISFHNCKSMLAIREAKEQINALHDVTNVNAIINLRINTKHIKNDIDDKWY